jgi:signal transduction histidine kinase/CheY-like chemotaxis protein
MQQIIKKKWLEERTLANQSLSRFLLFSMGVLAFFSYFNYSQNLKTLALVQFFVLLTLPPVYSWLRKGAPLGVIKHLIGFDTLVIFVPLLFIPTAGNTGIYWVFGYPLIVFFFLGTRTGLSWTMTYSLMLVTGVALSQFGVLTLYYTPTQTTLALAELIIFIALGYFFTSDREKAENMQAIHLHYLQSVDKLERILHQPSHMDQALNRSLEVMLEIFSCSRAYLLHPLELNSKYLNVAYEKSVPEFPGSFSAGGKIPTSSEMLEELHNIQDSSEILLYGINRPIPGRPKWAKRFSIKSVMAIMIYPDHGKPWMLGLHECTHSRIWTEEEKRLFQDIARRMKDALNQMLLYRELMQSEGNLRQAIKQAEAASHAKSDFLSVMSHELRTPLHGIIGLQKLIGADMKQLGSEQQENLMLAQQSAKSLQALVNDILDLAKIESGNMELVKNQFELRNCICDALVPFILAAREKEVTLSLHLEETPKTIIGDESRLRQVLLNLAGNAVKFTEHGEVSIHVTRKEKQLHFSIKDTGVGISKKDLEHIFEPFVQLMEMNQAQQPGTGLGTSIVKSFVELMEGSIEASSEPGKGSCFYFTIPCHPVGNETMNFHSSSVEELFISTSDTKDEAIEPAPALRVLLAEDDPIGQRIASRQLSKAGMKVDVASNGEAAWEKLQSKSYDLLLTDVRMPGINGIKLTEKIRAMEKHSNKPRLLIIGLSAHALEDVANECLKAGMDHFMTKPVDPETILSTIINKASQ